MLMLELTQALDIYYIYTYSQFFNYLFLVRSMQYDSIVRFYKLKIQSQHWGNYTKTGWWSSSGRKLARIETRAPKRLLWHSERSYTRSSSQADAGC